MVENIKNIKNIYFSEIEKIIKNNLVYFQVLGVVGTITALFLNIESVHPASTFSLDALKLSFLLLFNIIFSVGIIPAAVYLVKSFITANREKYHEMSTIIDFSRLVLSAIFCFMFFILWRYTYLEYQGLFEVLFKYEAIRFFVSSTFAVYIMGVFQNRFSVISVVSRALIYAFSYGVIRHFLSSLFVSDYLFRVESFLFHFIVLFLLICMFGYFFELKGTFKKMSFFFVTLFFIILLIHAHAYPEWFHYFDWNNESFIFNKLPFS